MHLLDSPPSCCAFVVNDAVYRTKLGVLKQVTANAVESFIITSIAHYCLNVRNLHCIAEMSLGSSFLYITPLPLRLECFNTSLVKKMSTQALGNLVPLVFTAVTQMLLDSYQ